MMDATTLTKIASEIDLISVPATPDCSQFGGNPFVPKDFRLPKQEMRSDAG